MGQQRESQNPHVLTFSHNFRSEAEYREFKDGASVRLNFKAKDVYAVLGGSGTLIATLDGKPIPKDRRGADVIEESDGTTVVKVTAEDLFHLVTGSAVRA